MDDDHSGKLQSEQTGCVIDEALAFEYIDDAARRTDPPGDGGGGNSVGGADNGSERQTERPVEARENAGCNQRDPEDGEADQSKGEQQDADEVVVEIAPGGVSGGGVEQGREDGKEDEIRVEGNVGNTGDEAEEQSADDHDDQVGRALIQNWPILILEPVSSTGGSCRLHRFSYSYLFPYLLY